MSSSSKNVVIREVALHFLPVEMRVPLKFGSQVLREVTCARARVVVEASDGRVAEGWGETPLSVPWVWPSELPYETRHSALKAFCVLLARDLRDFPVAGHPMEIGFAYQRDRLGQADVSAAWPISEHWRVYGRSLYSLRDSKSIEHFAGFEYDSCCWRVRAVARDYVSRRSGERDRSFYLQLELKGLSSVGQAADAFLERAIRGYSASSRRR